MAYQVKEDYVITSIVNYLRRSRQDVEREKRTGEDTLTEQKNLMDRVLSALEIPYVQREEIGSGDKISTRPVFQDVIEEIKQGKYDAIAVKEISRLGRGSYTDMGLIYDLLREKRVYIITPYKTYDPNNPTDARQIRFELFLSREEFETTRERLVGARYNYAMQGKWMASKSPYGYKVNKNTQRLEIVEEDAKIVRLIFDLYVNGVPQESGIKKDVGFRAIATYLKRLGIQTPYGKNEWRYAQVSRVINNKAYVGTVEYRVRERKGNVQTTRPKNEHIVVEDAHEPIVDKKTWDKAQEKYDNRNKTDHTKLDFSPNELAGLFVCKSCGRKMVRQYSVQHYKKKDGEKSVYHKEFLWCTTSGCTFVKYQAAEESIIKTLEYMIDLDNDLLQQTLEDNLSEYYSDNNDSITQDELRQQIKQREKELKNRLSFIFEKYEQGIYSDDDFMNRKKQIEQELEEVSKIRIDETELKQERIINIDKIKQYLDKLLNIYLTHDNKTEKNEILKEIFDTIEIEVIEKGRGRKSAKFKIDVYFKPELLNI